MRIGRTFLPLVISIVATMAGITGCAGDPGEATPAPSTPAAPSDATPASGSAPEVANPLPRSVIQQDPCATLTPAQVDQLFTKSKPTGEASDTGAAQACSWSDTERGSIATVQLVYAWTNGLDTVYSKRNEAALFEELEPVQGYPTVAYGPTDDREQGMCSVAVGVADDAAFEADASLPDSSIGKADPCDAARTLANHVVTTMKGQS